MVDKERAYEAAVKHGSGFGSRWSRGGVFVGRRGPLEGEGVSMSAIDTPSEISQGENIETRLFVPWTMAFHRPKQSLHKIEWPLYKQ